MSMDRRRFLATSALAASAWTRLSRYTIAAEPKHVSWLAETQQRPEKLPADAKEFPSQLVDASGKPITTVEQWVKRRDEIRTWWQNFLGKMPAERDPARPPEFKVLEEDVVGKVKRQRIEYEVEPGISTEAYLCLPTDLAAPAPGVVCFHSTVDHSIRQPAGLGSDVQKAFGLKFAQQGRVVLSPRNFLWPTNDKIKAKEETEKYLARGPKSTGMAKMLHDALVAVDILAKLPNVDTNRLGAVGHSLGAKEVLYLAAFDERIKTTVSSEGGIGIRFSNWNAPWYLGPAVDEPGFTHDHHELLALCAPRPCLLVAGEVAQKGADGDRGWPFIASALPVYELYTKQPVIGQFNHRQGHAVPPIAEERIEQFFAAYL
jgi:dienelactone hydrolase